MGSYLLLSRVSRLHGHLCLREVRQQILFYHYNYFQGVIASPQAIHRHHHQDCDVLSEQYDFLIGSAYEEKKKNLQVSCEKYRRNIAKCKSKSLRLVVIPLKNGIQVTNKILKQYHHRDLSILDCLFL